MLFLLLYLDQISILLSQPLLCNVLILNVIILIKSSFGGYYNNKLVCLNNILQANL